MKRSKLREHVFMLLFLSDFHEKDELSEQVELYFSQFAPMLSLKYDEDSLSDEEAVKEIEDGKTEICTRFFDVLEHLGEIDVKLSNAATGWTLNRMSKTDLMTLRLACYEIMYDDSVPAKVAINEAVELAKNYGGEQSPSFVNGVLAKVIR